MVDELDDTRRTLSAAMTAGFGTRPKIVTKSSSRIREQDLLWMRPIPPSAQERLASPRFRRLMCKNIGKFYKGFSPSVEESTIGSAIVEYGRELGMDLSRVGYAEDLYEWMDEYYRVGTTTNQHPKDVYLFCCRNCSLFGLRVMVVRPM